MSDLRRIYVEKKPGFDTEATLLCKELKEFLGIRGLERVRIVHRYDIEGISNDEYRQSRETIFSEAPVDYLYDEDFIVPDDYRVVAIEYLPGQYDQRADSAAQSIQLLTAGEKPVVNCARLILLQGDISEQDYQEIKSFCINPLDSQEACLEKPDSLQMEIEYPGQVKRIKGFIAMDREQLSILHDDLGLAMSLADLNVVQQYFRQEERDPSITEVRVLDTYWSDHCRHTTFLTEIKDVDFEQGPYTPAIKESYQRYLLTRKEIYGEEEKAISLMDLAVIGMKEMKKRGLLADLDQSEEINACSIKVKVDRQGEEEDWLIMFKNETHNHPTEIEPFGGAATCLGGAIRDPLSGRSYVYQAMRVTGSGDPRTPVSQTREGKLPQRKITTVAARGYSSYGNQIGLATGQVAELYNERFIAKRMEIGAVIAAAPAKNVVRERPQAGDIIILLGGRTGRDGCGGATGSSKKHTEESLITCGSEVQKGNPPTERKIQRLFRDPEVSRLIKRCNDFGAGGVSVAIGELADSLDINLDAVPKKYEGLDGTELAISESQERMAVVLAEQDVQRFIEKAEEENLESTPVAVVTNTGRLRMNWQGDTIVNLSREFLDTNGARQYSKVTVQAVAEENNYFSKIPESIARELPDLEQGWQKNLAALNVCSKKGLVEQFDSTIGAGSVLLPFGGKEQLTPVEGMVAKIPLMEGDTSTGTIMTHGYNPGLACWSPFHGAVYALLEAVVRSVALGGDYRTIRFSLQEYFERLGSDRKRWGKPFSALLGAYLVQSELGLPAIGGKDSMSGSFNELDVPPTLVAFAVNLIDVKQTISPEFKESGNRVVWVKIKRDQYQLPVFTDLKDKYTAVHQLSKVGKIKAASAVGEGGVAAAVSKMAFGNKLGLQFKNTLEESLKIEELFLPEIGSLILEIDKDADLSGLGDYILLAETVEEPVIKYREIELPLSKALKSWQQPLEEVFPTRLNSASNNPEGKSKPWIPLYTRGNNNKARVRIARPRVLIPVFPGTNCEYDTARKFTDAGARTETFIFKNLTPQMVEESVQAMVKKIDQAQIIMLPGGFSAGDEPEGSGKFIATVFRNPLIREAIMRLLQERDGLMLGICNGFQALIKLGLLPYGEIREINETSPTLTFNTLGRHVSYMARTKVVSVLSPWLARVEAGSEFIIPVSHGEGRFVASPQVLEGLIANGQVATQYVDLDGKPGYDLRFNPNGSEMAIEGITSPDGKIFGKMGHSERIGTNVARNIPGEKDQQLFRAGVEYFL